MSSDIPTFIFIHTSSAVIPTTPSSEEVDENQHQPKMDKNISNEDIANMKRMIFEMRNQPELLREKCNIPKLPQSVSTKYQEWLAASTSSATDAPTDQVVREQQDNNDDISFMSYSKHSNDGYIEQSIHQPQAPIVYQHASSLLPITPPQVKQVMTMASTPQTQEMTLSFASMSSLPFHAPYCLECNTSTYSPSDDEQQWRPTRSSQNGLERRDDNFEWGVYIRNRL